MSSVRLAYLELSRRFGLGLAVRAPILFPLLQVYFPPDSLVAAHFTPSSHTSVCPWKGTAAYKDITVDGVTNEAAAWVYEEPKAAAANIKGLVAFWKGVQVSRS